jgi:hypothetical protein
MKHPNLLSIPLLVLFATALTAQTGEPAWELADPGSKVLIGINVRNIRDSAIGQSISAQMKNQPSPAAAMPFRVPGIELLSDIDSVFVASTAEMPAGKAATPAARKNPPFLLVLSGTFPPDHLQPLLSGKNPSYKAYNIYGSNGANFAVMDDHTLIFGDGKSIRAAIDRKGAKPTIASPVFARAQELAAANDVWIVAKDTAEGMRQAAGAAPFASEIEGLELGMQLRQGFGLDLNLATKTEAAAAMLAQLITTQMQSAALGKSSDPAIAEILNKLQIGAEGNRMTMHVALTQEEMERSMNALQAARMNTGARAYSAHTPEPGAAPSRPATPPGPRKVRIYGLDEGVREITIDPKP